MIIRHMFSLFAIVAFVGAGCSSPQSTMPDTTTLTTNTPPTTITNDTAGIQARCPDGWTCDTHSVDIIMAQTGSAVAGFTLADTQDLDGVHEAFVAERSTPIVESQTVHVVQEGDVDRGRYALIEATSASGRKEMSMVITQTLKHGNVIVCHGSYDLANQNTIAKPMRAFCESVTTI